MGERQLSSHRCLCSFPWPEVSSRLQTETEKWDGRLGRAAAVLLPALFACTSVVACGGGDGGDDVEGAPCDVEIAGGTVATSVEGDEVTLALQRPGHEDREVGGFRARGIGTADYIYPTIDPDRTTVLIFSTPQSDYLVRGDESQLRAERVDGCSLPADRVLYVADGDPGPNPVVDRTAPPPGFQPAELKDGIPIGFMA